MTNHNEECFVLLGKVRKTRKWRAWRTKYSVGEPCSVNFNYDWVMEREEKKGDILGWWHTHPNSIASPSMTDYATMQAWVCSFGRPLLCCIHGVDGLRAHWFFDDESPHVEGVAKRFGSFFWGMQPDEPDELRPEYDLTKLVSRKTIVMPCIGEEESFEEFNAIQKGGTDGE